MPSDLGTKISPGMYQALLGILGIFIVTPTKSRLYIYLFFIRQVHTKKNFTAQYMCNVLINCFIAFRAPLYFKHKCFGNNENNKSIDRLPSFYYRYRRSVHYRSPLSGRTAQRKTMINQLGESNKKLSNNNQKQLI